MKAALAAARADGLPVTMLGGGSNVLVADAGVRGLVIRDARRGRARRVGRRSIRADGGLTINGLVRWTINRGVAGLEAWAGTPGTVGGAIYGNAHFKGRLIGELVEQRRAGDRRTARGSRCRGRHGVRLRPQPPAAHARGGAVGGFPRRAAASRRRCAPIARESLAYRKRTQPLESASAGCIFQNPDPAVDRVPDGIPASAGALVDRAGLKGIRDGGGARVSPTHGNFIVNEGGASADEIRALIEACRERVRARFGVELRDEIVYLGF